MVDKEVIILGMGLTRSLCPYDAEVWSVNNGYRQIVSCIPCYLNTQKAVPLEISNGGAICPQCNATSPIPRIDKIFLAHTQCWDEVGDALFNWDELNYLADKGVEIINTHRVKGLKAKIFPFNRLVKKFGRNYFSDTIGYMLVYALDKNYTHIRIYGVDMHTHSEYAQEKGGIEYWLGRIEEQGIKLEIGEGSSLLRTANGHPYGTNLHQKYYYYDEKGRKRLFKAIHKKPVLDNNFKALDKIRTPSDR